MSKIFQVNNKKSSAINIICFMLVAVILATISVVAFADGEIANAVTKIANDIYKILASILNPVCVAILAFCIIRLILGSNSKGAESSIQWIKRVVIGFACFNMLGLFLTYGENLMKSVGGQYKTS